MLTPTNSCLLLGVLTSVPILVKIDQEMSYFFISHRLPIFELAERSHQKHRPKLDKFTESFDRSVLYILPGKSLSPKFGRYFRRRYLWTLYMASLRRLIWYNSEFTDIEDSL